MGSGQGQGQGQGSGTGQGNQPAPTPGSRPGDGRQGSQQGQAMVQALQRKQPGGGTRRQKPPKLLAGEPPGTLGAQDIERLPGAARPPSAVSDANASRYPAEYRRLVRDYFRAVAGGK